MTSTDNQHSQQEALHLTDKEFKRLNRAQLIDIIYQLQLQVDALTVQNMELEKALADKRFRINTAGNIAEAALEINDCFRNVQNAAEQYLSEIKAIREETAAECERILAQAQTEADEIIAIAKKRHSDYESALEVILKEYRQNPSDNG